MTPMLTVANCPAEECGVPPEIAHTVEHGRFVSCFENVHGEPFLFVVDRKTKCG